MDPRDLSAEIGALDLSHPVALKDTLAVLQRRTRSQQAISYLAVPRERGWDLDLCQWVGEGTAAAELRLREYFRSMPADPDGYLAYDPSAVELAQRNRALTVAELVRIRGEASSSHARVYRALRISDVDQLRMLVTDGPRLLGWIGLTRQEPFGADDVALLQAALSPLRQRLQLRLRGEVAKPALLEALLLHMHEPILVLSRAGRVELANRAGESLLETATGRAELAQLRVAVVSGRETAAPAPYRLSRLQTPAMPPHWLAIRSVTTVSNTERIARAKIRWQLGPKATRVLGLLCDGLSNKDIAAKLDCAEVTVERHLTRLFRATGTRSRAELVAMTHRL